MVAARRALTPRSTVRITLTTDLVDTSKIRVRVNSNTLAFRPLSASTLR
jgi:hypothetical protein